MVYITQSVHRNAQVRKHAIATVSGRRKQTWLEFKNRIACFAAALKNMGVKQGDRVAILALNSDRYFEYYYAIPWADACVVPLNIRWSPSENAYILNDAGAKVLIVDDAFVNTIQKLSNQNVTLDAVIYIGERECPVDMLDYETLIQTHSPVDDVYRKNDDLAGIFYTGGTTGFPKGVMLSHINLWAMAMSVPYLIQLSEYSTILHTGPMFHMADIMMTMGGAVAASKHVFLPKFTSGAVIRSIENNKITHASIVPTMLQRIINDKSLQSSDTSSLECILYGGSSITVPVLKKALKAFPNTRFAQGYGQTELSPLATMLLPQYHVTEGADTEKLKSAGRAIPCAEIRIVDMDSKPLLTREIGEIIVRGPQAMQGYWQKPEATAASFKNGWVHTGDLGYMDEEGFIFIVDRLKDMIIFGGENIYSTEVENAISQVTGVEQVVVIGVPSEKWGEEVHAEVILEQGVSMTEVELVNQTKKYLSNYKCPRSVTFRTTPFPVSGAGKLLKQEIKKGYWQKRHLSR